MKYRYKILAALAATLLIPLTATSQPAFAAEGGGCDSDHHIGNVVISGCISATGWASAYVDGYVRTTGPASSCNVELQLLGEDGSVLDHTQPLDCDGHKTGISTWRPFGKYRGSICVTYGWGSDYHYGCSWSPLITMP
ncbi:hypothetical protein ACQP1V_15875 [Microtetraspora malaysiensis]|uniref:hypothetical protein n=1 Tax=Microtetraspora malaysiensis TaxID=161358 RepID=UPI003D9462F3